MIQAIIDATDPEHPVEQFANPPYPAANTHGRQRTMAQPTTRKTPGARHGGRILADALVAQGIDHVFEVPGESFLDTLDGLYDQGKTLKLVTCRFEAGAVNMAEAYGKLKGCPAAAMVTRGPGACHGSIGVHVAFQDSTPMLLFVGQIPHEDTGRDAFQEVDYRQMFAPLAKWVTQIDHTHRIPEVVAHAVDVATSGRPGPVVIALSEEMQKVAAEVPDLPRANTSFAFPDPAALREMRAMLAKAKKPVAVVGGSCWTVEGRAALKRFLTANTIPVTVGFRRQAHYDGTLDNFAGDLGVGSDPQLIGKIKEADLILAIGSRLGDAVTQGYTLLDVAGTIPIIQVSPDGGEIGRVFRTALGIVSDLNIFALAAADLEPVKPTWAAWTRELRSLREAQRAVPNYQGTLNLGTVMRELETLLTPDAIVTTDAGNFAADVNPDSLEVLKDARIEPAIDPIEDFVANKRAGNCEYFASAMTMMLRSQGIPAAGKAAMKTLSAYSSALRRMRNDSVLRCIASVCCTTCSTLSAVTRA